MQESQNTAEGRTDAGKPPAPTSEPVSDVVDILRNANVDETDEQETEDEGNDESARAQKKIDVPKSLDALAEGLGVDVADLYNLEVPLGGEQGSVTLGQLKDLGKAGSQIDLDRIEFEERQTEFEAQQRKAAQDMADLIASLPRKAITDELVGKIHQQRAAIQEREEQLLAGAIPQWSDPVVKERDRTAMADYLAEFGFPQGFLDTVVDHKTQALIRDAALRKQRLSKALEQVRQVKNTGHGTQTKTSKPKSKAGTSPPRTRAADQKVDQVADLISSALKV